MSDFEIARLQEQIKITVIPETAEDKFYRLEQQNLILMGALADLYEEILALKEGGVQ